MPRPALGLPCTVPLLLHRQPAIMTIERKRAVCHDSARLGPRRASLSFPGSSLGEGCALSQIVPATSPWRKDHREVVVEEPVCAQEPQQGRGAPQQAAVTCRPWKGYSRSECRRPATPRPCALWVSSTAICWASSLYPSWEGSKPRRTAPLHGFRLRLPRTGCLGLARVRLGRPCSRRIVRGT